MTRPAWAAIAALALLAGCKEQGETPQPPAAPSGAAAAANATPSPLPPPDPAACPAIAEPNADLARTAPLAVPAPLSPILAASRDRYAVRLLGGGTLCVATDWIEQADAPTLSPDGRFVSFGWEGYEAFGHVVVDRAGKGQEIDTGSAPMFSPSRQRMAAVDLSESAFGALNAFAVWQIETDRTRELAKVADAGLPTGHWRIERWRGEDCIELGLLPTERNVGDPMNIDRVPHDPWFAARDNRWKPQPGRCRA